MGEGLEVMPGLAVTPPRFRFIHDPRFVHRAMRLRLHRLDTRLPRTPAELAAGLWSAGTRILDGSGGEARRRVGVLIERIERGDFRPLLQARGERTEDAFEDAVHSLLVHPDTSASSESLF
jgi:hypothetical protein